MLKKIAFLMSMFLFITIGVNLGSQTIVSIGGDWNFIISVGGQEMNAGMTIKQEGENIKVIIKNSAGAERGGAGHVKGNEIEWTEINKNGSQEVIVIYKGKIERDVINGYCFPKDNESSRLDWKAVRKAKGFGA